MDASSKIRYYARPRRRVGARKIMEAKKVLILPDAKRNLRKRFSKSHVTSQARKIASDCDLRKNMVLSVGRFGQDLLSPMIYVLSGNKSIIVATKRDALDVADAGEHGLIDMVSEASRMMSDAN